MKIGNEFRSTNVRNGYDEEENVVRTQSAIQSSRILIDSRSLEKRRTRFSRSLVYYATSQRTPTGKVPFSQNYRPSPDLLSRICELKIVETNAKQSPQKKKCG